MCSLLKPTGGAVVGQSPRGPLPGAGAGAGVGGGGTTGARRAGAVELRGHGAATGDRLRVEQSSPPPVSFPQCPRPRLPPPPPPPLGYFDFPPFRRRLVGQLDQLHQRDLLLRQV